MNFGAQLVEILVMLFFNALFVAYEMGIASITRTRLVVLVNRKKKGAEEALFMKDRMEATLAVVQVGITLTAFIAAATGGAGVAETLTPFLIEKYELPKFVAEIISLFCLIIPLSTFTIIFAELFPKVLALNNKEVVCLALSPIMKRLVVFTYPVVVIFERIVKGLIKAASKSQHFKNKVDEQTDLHELTAAVALARTSKLIGAREEKIVLSAAQLSSRHVRESMIPIRDVSLIPVHSSLSDALLRAHFDMHTRFPVCAKEGDPQSIEGYINFKDIVVALKLNSADPTIKGIVRPIKTVRAESPISHVLEEMMQGKLHIAMVADGQGHVIGMITLEDIIEELVGEIEDEFDRLPTHVHPYSGGWIIGGGVTMSIVAQTVNVPLETLTQDPNQRLADWCSRLSQTALKGTDIFERGNVQFMIRKLRRKKAAEVVVSLIQK